MASVNGVRSALGMLCDQLTRHPSMAAEIEAAGAAPQLRALLALVRDGAAFDRARAAELLDAVEEACARYGLPEVVVRGHGDALLPPGFHLLPDSAEPAGAWVCPWGRCGRVVFPGEVAEAPVCASGGTPLAAFRAG